MVLCGKIWELVAVTALADIEEGAYATENELENIKEIKYDDLSSQFEDMKRNMEMFFVPLGESLIPKYYLINGGSSATVMEAMEPLLELLDSF